jgi:hypothetical protein
VVCDGAGWHQPGKRLSGPDKVTLLPLPPYAPELKPTENVWDYLRAKQARQARLGSYEAIVAACKDAWLFLTADPLHRLYFVSLLRRASIFESAGITLLVMTFLGFPAHGHAFIGEPKPESFHRAGHIFDAEESVFAVRDESLVSDPGQLVIGQGSFGSLVKTRSFRALASVEFPTARPVEPLPGFVGIRCHTHSFSFHSFSC